MANQAAAKTVLVVDDDQGIRQCLHEILRSEGYQVELAANGQEALARLREAAQPPPCLILVDLMMPVMDGRQLRAELLRDARLSHIPVVVLSADRNIAGKMGNLGISSALQKPVHIDDLLGTISRYLH